MARLPDGFDAAETAAMVVDQSPTSVAMVLVMARQASALCVLVPHSRKDELWPGAVREAMPSVRVGWLPDAFGQYTRVRIDGDDDRADVKAGVVVFTTGTTGRAKAVLYDWTAMRRQAEYTVRVLDLPRFEIVAATHVAHAYSINALFVSMLPECVRLHVVPSPAQLADTLTSLRPGHPTVMLGSPSTYALLCKQPDLRGPLPIDIFYSAGCSLPQATWDQFEARFGQRILQNYGSSETGNIAFVNRADLDALRAVDASSKTMFVQVVGSPVQEDSVRLEPPLSGTLLADGFPGEICVRADWTSLGYVHHGRLEPHPAWYRTGDMGRWHVVGGRRMLVTGPRLRAPIRKDVGEPPMAILLQPWQLEELYARLDGVDEAVVVGLRGAGVGALIVLKPGATMDGVQRSVNSQLKDYARPSLIVSVDAIPRSAAGKVYYPEVERLLEDSSKMKQL